MDLFTNEYTYRQIKLEIVWFSGEDLNISKLLSINTHISKNYCQYKHKQKKGKIHDP